MNFWLSHCSTRTAASWQVSCAFMMKQIRALIFFLVFYHILSFGLWCLRFCINWICLYFFFSRLPYHFFSSLIPFFFFFFVIRIRWLFLNRNGFIWILSLITTQHCQGHSIPKPLYLNNDWKKTHQSEHVTIYLTCDWLRKEPIRTCTYLPELWLDESRPITFSTHFRIYFLTFFCFVYIYSFFFFTIYSFILYLSIWKTILLRRFK